MTRKRRRNGDRTEESVQRRDKRAQAFARPPALAIVAALLIAVACIVPFMLWGNPYPEGVVPYWAWGTVLTVLIGGAAAFFPRHSAGGLPRVLSGALMRLSPARFALAAASLAVALSLVYAVYAFGRSASTPDEIAQLWHANILLRGRLSLPVDPNREFFGLATIVDVGRWYSQYPIGGPLALVPGALIRAPWLVNPVLVGVAAVAMYAFARRAYGETEGRAIAALFSVTPMVLAMAGTWMNHVPVLLLTTCAIAALVEWDGAATSRRALICVAGIGLSLGMIATIRPLDAVVVAFTVGTFQLWTIRHNWYRVRELALQAVCGTLGVAPLFYANRATTGSAFRFGYDVIWGGGHRVGFHTDPYGTPHTLSRALEFAISYVSELNMYLLAWPVPAMLIIVLGLVAMLRVTRWDALLLSLFGAQVAAYAAYWGDGEFLGPRFLYTALPAVVVLVARAPFHVVERFGSKSKRGVVAFVMCSMVVAWCAPDLQFNVVGFAKQAHLSRRTLKVDVAGTIAAASIHNALVFIREPLGMRLSRRMWGLGISRSDAAQLIASRDACSLLRVIRVAELNGGVQDTAAARSIIDQAKDFVPSTQAVRTGDRTIHILSAASIDPACMQELKDDNRLGSVAFGPALPLDPIDDHGRINGDVIYVADLGDRNAVLKSRFGDRAWYRLVLAPADDGSLRPVLIAY